MGNISKFLNNFGGKLTIVLAFVIKTILAKILKLSLELSSAKGCAIVLSRP